MGKSALVRAAVADVQAEKPKALALVQLAPGALPTFPTLIAELAGQSRAVLLLIDDLGFGADGRAEMLALRSLLDGGVAARPPHHPHHRDRQPPRHHHARRYQLRAART